MMETSRALKKISLDRPVPQCGPRIALGNRGASSGGWLSISRHRSRHSRVGWVQCSALETLQALLSFPRKQQKICFPPESSSGAPPEMAHLQSRIIQLIVLENVFAFPILCKSGRQSSQFGCWTVRARLPQRYLIWKSKSGAGNGTLDEYLAISANFQHYLQQYVITLCDFQVGEP